MKKLAIAVISLLSISSFVSAQTVGDVDPNATSGNQCVSLTNNLRLGMRDASTNNEVSLLQDFLNPKYLASEPTGYFGKGTLAAVKAFQADNGLLSSGYVGPMTRAKIKEISCSNATAGPATNNPQTTTGASSFNVNKSLSNPLTVSAEYFLGSPCSSYVLDWGDGTNSNYTVPSGVSCGQVMESYTKEHTYSKAGTYTVRFQTGNYPQQSASVTVGGSTCPTPGTAPVCPGTSTQVPFNSQTCSWNWSVCSPSSSQLIKVVYPAGGEQIQMNSGKDVDFRIYWTDSVGIGNAYVYLHYPDGGMCYLGSVLSAKGNFGVTPSNYNCPNIPRTITPGQYTVLIKTDGSYSAESATFTLVSNASLACTRDLDCPVGNTCVLATGRCVQPAPTQNTVPAITGITPAQGTAGSSIRIDGTNLSGVTTIEFLNSSNQFIASLASPSIVSVSSNYVYFTIPASFAANVSAGTYQVRVVSNTCAGGCNSNTVVFSLSAPTLSSPTVSATANQITNLRPGEAYDLFTITANNLTRSNPISAFIVTLDAPASGVFKQITIVDADTNEQLAVKSGYAGYLRFDIPVKEYAGTKRFTVRASTESSFASYYTNSQIQAVFDSIIIGSQIIVPTGGRVFGPRMSIASSVALPPKIDILGANPVSVSSTQQSTLSWSTSNTTSCTLDGVAVSVRGSKNVSGGSHTLACTGPGGTVNQSIDIPVYVIETPTPVRLCPDGTVVHGDCPAPTKPTNLTTCPTGFTLVNGSCQPNTTTVSCNTSADYVTDATTQGGGQYFFPLTGTKSMAVKFKPEYDYGSGNVKYFGQVAVAITPGNNSSRMIQMVVSQCPGDFINKASPNGICSRYGVEGGGNVAFGTQTTSSTFGINLCGPLDKTKTYYANVRYVDPSTNQSTCDPAYGQCNTVVGITYGNPSTQNLSAETTLILSAESINFTGLAKGANEVRVSRLKEILRTISPSVSAGCANLSTSNTLYGPTTEECVKVFQNLNELEPTGSVNEQTNKALNRVLAR